MTNLCGRVAGAALVLAAGVAGAAAEDPALLFRSDFDAYSVKAGFAKGGGSTRLFGEESLQLRMWPGAAGSVNALAYSKSESCAYPLKGNLDPRQGTISFWVSSLGWKPSAKTFQWFVTARQPGFVLHVYKYQWPGLLYFYLEVPGANGEPQRQFVGARVEDRDWADGAWHKIDVTWNATGMKFYLDGVPPKVSERTAWLKPSLVFPAPLALPEASAEGELVINATPVRSGAEKDERTAFDELRVHARPLSEREIRDAYVAVVPSAFGTRREKPLLGIPRGAASVTVDGRLDAAEWADAACAPLADIAGFSRDPETALAGTVRLKRDADSLYVGLTANRPPRRATVAARDGNVWEDDSFEIVLGKGADAFHFIVNANGALYDERNGLRTWTSAATSAATADAQGWRAELRIPLADVGGLPTGGNFGLSAYRSEAVNDIDAVAWAPVSGAFVDARAFGDLVACEAPVSLRGTGRLAAGEVALDLSGAATFEAFVEKENGERVTCGAKLGADVWRYAPDPGRQRLFVQATGPDGAPALRWERYFYVNREIELIYDCHARDGFLAATATLSGALATRAAQGGLAGAFRLVRKADGAVVSETACEARGSSATGRVPIAALAVGDYVLEATFGGETATARFAMPDLTACRDKVGLEPAVPPPWHSVRADGPRAWRVLDRVYAFGEGPFPVRLVSRGSEMFTDPPKVCLDGREVRWSGFRVTGTRDDVVTFAGEGAAGVLAFEWTAELWFDGFYRLDLRAKGTGAVASLTLSYAVPREHARYVFKQGYREALFAWTDDRIEKVFDPLTHPAESLHWTSGVEKGVAFGCVSDANWANRPGEANVVYTRDARDVRLLAKVISRPVEVTRPLAWTFVLQGTPARTPDREWRAVNVGGYRVPTMQNRQFGGYGEKAFFDSRSPDRWTTPSNYRFRWPEWFLESQKAAPKTTWKTKSHLPFLSLAYVMPMHLGTNEPEFDYFFHDAAKRPALTWSYAEDGVKQTEYAVCDTRVFDICLARMDWFLKNTRPTQGIYNDCAHVMNCNNERHGHGGTDAFGRSFSSVCWLPQREYFLREFRLVRAYGRTVRNHVPAADFVPFVMDFADDVWPGEEFYASVLENLDSYTEDISPEAWQSAFNATIRGVPNHLLAQFGRAAGAMDEAQRKKHDFAESPEWAERVLAAALPHDVPVSAAWISPKTVDRWWIIKEDLRLWDATFHGYWFDETLRTATKDLYVSWYELPAGAPYRRLAVASNFARRDAPLGLSGQALEGAVAFHELWTDRPLDAADLATLVVPAKKFVLIGVK